MSVRVGNRVSWTKTKLNFFLPSSHAQRKLKVRETALVNPGCDEVMLTKFVRFRETLTLIHATPLSATVHFPLSRFFFSSGTLLILIFTYPLFMWPSFDTGFMLYSSTDMLLLSTALGLPNKDKLWKINLTKWILCKCQVGQFVNCRDNVQQSGICCSVVPDR